VLLAPSLLPLPPLLLPLPLPLQPSVSQESLTAWDRQNEWVCLQRPKPLLEQPKER
jgi:hypothetical protein